MEEHIHDIQTMDANHARDFMDAYANEIRKRSAEPDDSSTFEVEQMLSIFSDLFITGSETTAATLRWAIVYILNFPEIKERLQSDIDRVLGEDSFPSLDDKSKLPYVEGFILETLRFADIVPLSVPHATVDDKDIIFEGFRIPKGTTVMFNLDSVLSDPDIFENPKEFNPDRFLNEHGDVFQQKRTDTFQYGAPNMPR